MPDLACEAPRPIFPILDEDEDSPTINLAEFPGSRWETIEMLRAHCGDWFHRMQMESIGARLERSNPAFVRDRGEFDGARLDSIEN